MSSTQRKLIVMFADVSGSTALFERLGDKEAIHAVERCLKRMKRSVEGYKGKTIQIVGDELLGAFESAEEACQAAIDMQLRIADLPPVSGLKLTIRIGLHVGMVTYEGDKLTGPSITAAARIAGLARRDQILCSSALVAELSPASSVTTKPMPNLGTIGEGDESLSLFQIYWSNHRETGGYPDSVTDQQSIQPVERLCLRYRGKAYLLDDKTQVLTIGRDTSNKLAVDDRKVSRLHARIEKRNNGYYLIDTSTNGTFVMLSGRREVLVRRNELPLDGKGQVCFGNSGNDPEAEIAEFELL